MALGSIQPLTEMSTRNLPGGKERPACMTDNLTAICEPIFLNVGASTCHNPMGPPRPVTGVALPYLFYIIILCRKLKKFIV
jgi:hypothetical protein